MTCHGRHRNSSRILHMHMGSIGEVSPSSVKSESMVYCTVDKSEIMVYCTVVKSEDMGYCTVIMSEAMVYCTVVMRG